MKVLRKEIEERRCFALIETGEQLCGGFVFEPSSQGWVLRTMWLFTLDRGTFRGGKVCRWCLCNHWGEGNALNLEKTFRGGQLSSGMSGKEAPVLMISANLCDDILKWALMQSMQQGAWKGSEEERQSGKILLGATAAAQTEDKNLRTRAVLHWAPKAYTAQRRRRHCSRGSSKKVKEMRGDRMSCKLLTWDTGVRIEREVTRKH